ncbi:hypothetical protein [Burkholderia sp. Ac-20344]|uniref:hypothetical protein n=1 Tax=Burkholderia sp. Ac-20344 TaxID=2703890 RepID=UPI00197BD80E|nr:hypothetical protein [Burkholderia sp. Ac-20344]
MDQIQWKESFRFVIDIFVEFAGNVPVPGRHRVFQFRYSVRPVAARFHPATLIDRNARFNCLALRRQ